MTVSVKCGSLFVDDKEFVIKGFVYSPYLIGQRPGRSFPKKKVVELDFKLMKIAKTNTIRLFSDKKKETPNYVYDLAEKYDIKIIQGIDIVREDFNLEDAKFLKKYKRRIKKVVDRLQNRKSLLMWCVGNEISANGDGRKLILFKKLLRYLKRIDDHPITYSNFGTFDHPFRPDDELDIVSAALYIWGAWDKEAKKAYKSNLEMFLHRAGNKPFMITEIGASTSDILGWLGKGHGGCSEDDQAQFIKDRWSVIEEYLPTNYFSRKVFEGELSNFCIGACIFEWSNEFWKFYIGENSRYSDIEKKFGVVNTNRIPKKSYYTLKKIWSHP